MNEILLYGPIGVDFWEPENSITAKSVIDQLKNIDGDVTVRISSGGGDVYEGIDIMNALKNHDGEVIVIVESLAASAASFIAVGGADKILMRDSSEMMIHRAWTWTEGNADEVRKTLSDLERQDTKLANIYASKAGGNVGDWLTAMSKETWYAADEAIAAGLADGLVSALEPVQASKIPSFSASRKRFKYSGRASAPPPINHAPLGQEKESAMDLKNLAQELGMEAGQLKNALTKIVNESIEVVTNVEVTYPADTKVVPTGKVRVSPVGEGDLPEGLAFSLGEVPEGWSAEINDSTGELTVVAPAVAPGESATFVVTAQGTGAATEFNVTVAVKSAAEEEDPVADPAAHVVDPAAPVGDTRTVDSDTYNELVAMAKLGVNAYHEGESRKREAEVDKWIKEGRINASLRAKAVKAMERDPEAARAVYGENPKNTIPRGEIGYGRDSSEGEDPEAAARRQKPNPFPKPSF